MENLVSIIACENYEQELVNQAVKDAVDKLGGIEKFVKSGQKVAYMDIS